MENDYSTGQTKKSRFGWFRFGRRRNTRDSADPNLLPEHTTPEQLRLSNADDALPPSPDRPYQHHEPAGRRDDDEMTQYQAYSPTYGEAITASGAAEGYPADGYPADRYPPERFPPNRYAASGQPMMQHTPYGYGYDSGRQA